MTDESAKGAAGSATAMSASVVATRQFGDGGIVVLDDLFPHPGSAFRFEEFRSYLDAMPEVRILSTGGAFPFADERRSLETVIAEHIRVFPGHAGRVSPLHVEALPRACLYYAIFLHVIYGAIDAIERQARPFAFTLYPGGSFALHEEISDARLRRVLGSPCFRKVIVTQPVTRRYLLDNRFCRADQIVELNGGVLTRVSLPPPVGKRWYARDKTTFDIAFVANRYSPTGADKGYDLFVEAAQALVSSGVDIRFHVVGRYDATILDLGDAADRFTFYGPQLTPFFDDFYRRIDVIVSPNQPFVLGAGKFDGFPTGCVVEAGMREVAIICTDELDLNVDYVDGEDLIIVRSDVDEIVASIKTLAAHPARLRALGANARRRALDIYSRERQMLPRIALLRQLVAEEGGDSFGG